jgi:deoxyinosine 3'endonuclease (endonuclease V)
MTDIEHEWIREQTKIASFVEIKDHVVRPIQYIGGMDISFVADSQREDSPISVACACFTILSFPDFKMIHTESKMFKVTLPYIPTFLAFREAGPLAALYEEVRQKHPQWLPDVVLVDGNGIYHPRSVGLATHLGVLLDIPTIGVAKTILQVGALTREIIEKQCESLSADHDSFELETEERGVMGVAFRGPHSVQPLFISPGHKVSVERASEIVRACCEKFKIPEPIRVADLGSRDTLRKWEEKHSWKEEVHTLDEAPPVTFLTKELGSPLEVKVIALDDDEKKDKVLHAVRLTLPSTSTETKESSKVKSPSSSYLVFVCDCSGSMGDSFRDLLIPACASAYQKITPEKCTMILFGKQTTRVEVKNAGDIRAYALHPLEGETNISIGFHEGVKAILQHNKTSNSDWTYTMVYASDGQDTHPMGDPHCARTSSSLGSN